MTKELHSKQALDGLGDSDDKTEEELKIYKKLIDGLELLGDSDVNNWHRLTYEDDKAKEELQIYNSIHNLSIRLPEHTANCICIHPIYYNYYIIHKRKSDIHVIGSECINSFKSIRKGDRCSRQCVKCDKWLKKTVNMENWICDNCNNKPLPVDIDSVRKHPNKPWNWSIVSADKNTTMEFIIQHPEFPWEWEHISKNPNLTTDMIRKNLDKPLDWASISLNITMDAILAFPDKPWNWKNISSNKNLTKDIVITLKDKPWDWYEVCYRFNFDTHVPEMLSIKIKEIGNWRLPFGPYEGTMLKYIGPKYYLQVKRRSGFYYKEFVEKYETYEKYKKYDDSRKQDVSDTKKKKFGRYNNEDHDDDQEEQKHFDQEKLFKPQSSPFLTGPPSMPSYYENVPDRIQMMEKIRRGLC